MASLFILSCFAKTFPFSFRPYSKFSPDHISLDKTSVIPYIKARRSKLHRNMIHFQRRMATVLVCVAVVSGLNSCISQILGQVVRQQIKEAGVDLLNAKDKEFQKINSKSYSDFMQKVDQACSAKVWVRKGLRNGVTKDFVLTPAEFSQLKEILQRTAPVPQAKQELLPMTISRAYNKRLVLFDASGRQVYSVAYSNKWMKESQMKELSADRTAGLFEADWFLPDADYDALFALPSVQAAESWANTAR